MDAKTAQHLMRDLNELPMLPNSLVQLMSLNPKNEDFFEQFENICKQEPALTIKVLKIANSSFYGTRNQIVDIKDAIIRLGVTTLSNLFTTLVVTKVFVPSHQNEKRLWQHSLQVAFLAEEISKYILHLDESWQHRIYTCGLLHDIGMFIQFATAPEKMAHIDDFDWQTPSEHIEAEANVFRIYHTELGVKLAQRWSLPKLVEHIIKFHHSYDLPTKVQENKGVYHVLRVIQLADFISEYFYHHSNDYSQDGFISQFDEYPILVKWAEANTDFNALYTVALDSMQRAQRTYLELQL